MKHQRQVEVQQQVVQLSNPEEATNNSEIVKLLSMNPAGAYHMDGLVAGVQISFMLDKGYQLICCGLMYRKRFPQIRLYYSGIY